MAKKNKSKGQRAESIVSEFEGEIKTESRFIPLLDFIKNETSEEKAAELLKTTLNRLGSELIIDGVMDSKTIEEISKYDQVTINNNLVNEMITHIRLFAVQNPQEEVFKGQRIAEVKKFIIF